MVAWEAIPRILLRSSRSNPFITESTVMRAGDPERDAEGRDEADERDEADALLRPQVPQPDRELEGPDHGAAAAGSGRRATWRRR